MRITIVGAGAMGSLIAARLTQASSFAVARTDTAPASAGEHSRERIERVLLFGRPSAHLDAIHAHGLQLTELDGSTLTVPIETSSAPADVKGSDVVIVLVKSWASAEAVAPLRTYLTRDTVVLTLQNGLGNASMLR
ncbi:MAG: ketopantoate reductase family protein, partial [Thermomicrobiales bacterium]